MSSNTWKSVYSGQHDYYSGLDAAIWFGTGDKAVFLGNTVSLEYSLQEMVMPLMAYSDYTKRRTARGQRIVHGSIVVMYQQTLLMYLLLEHLSGTLDYNDKDIKLAAYIPEHIPELGSIIKDKFALPAIAGALLPSQTLGRLANISTQLKSTVGLSTFDMQKAQYKNLAAKASSKSAKPAAATELPGTLLQMQTRLSGLYPRYGTVPEGFTITIDFKKNPEGPTALEVEDPQIILPLSYAEAAKNMGEVYGRKNTAATTLNRSLDSAPDYTVRKIVGVELSGMQQIIDDSGRPLMESYSFIASDLI